MVFGGNNSLLLFLVSNTYRISQKFTFSEQVFRNFLVFTAVSGKFPTIKIVHSPLSGIGCSFRKLFNGHLLISSVVLKSNRSFLQ